METQQVLAAGGGDRTPAQRLTRNRAISAAYARLAVDDARGRAAVDERFRWAGLASVVSTQAHCAMEHADDAVAATGRAVSQVPEVLRSSPIAVGGAAYAAGAATAHGMAGEVQAALYDSNREIFADIYPAMLMYKRHGLPGVSGGPEQCGPARPDRRLDPALVEALRKIDTGHVADGSLDLANYEQRVIVQRRIYDDPNRPLLVPAMRVNQGIADSPAAGLARRFLPVQKPEIPISTECGQGTPVPFAGDITVADDRVRYYLRLMTEYKRHTPAQRAAMGQVIAGRDPRAGGPDYGRRP